MDRLPNGRAARLCRAALIGLGLVLAVQARATAAEDLRPGRHGRVQHQAGARPLTVHRVARREGLPRPLLVRREVAPIDRDFVFRDWNDTRLTRWGPFRFGGNVFYGDGRGDPINYGNPTLAGIAGYGPARGGFGGPHFDSVGGFHPGPGPDAKEDDDYASGSINTPDYDGPVPNYGSAAQRVGALNGGVRLTPVRASAGEGGPRRPVVARATLPVPAAPRAPVANDDDDALPLGGIDGDPDGDKDDDIF